jgi:hypothetical protein
VNQHLTWYLEHSIVLFTCTSKTGANGKIARTAEEHIADCNGIYEDGNAPPEEKRRSHILKGNHGGEKKRGPTARARWKLNPKKLITVKRVNLYILFQLEIETNSQKNTNLQKERERRMKKMNNCRSFLLLGNSEIQ